MNHEQHAAKITRDYAAMELNKTRRQLIGAIEVLKVVEEELQREVDADKTSWYGAP